MNISVKIRKIFATVTDFFVFSMFVRISLFFFYWAGIGTELSFLLSMVVGGTINYVLIPWYFNKQTLGMKMNGLFYDFSQSDTIRPFLVLASRFLSQLLLNFIFLGIPIAVNFVFLILRKDGTTIGDQLFSRLMVSRKN